MPMEIRPINHQLLLGELTSQFVRLPLRCEQNSTHVANDHTIMGDERNHWLANLLGWFTTAVMAAGAIALIATRGR